MKIYLIYGSVFIILFVLELLYFKIARDSHIIDIPNERSSHTNIVLRGGGIIFLLSIWIWALLDSFPLHTEIDFPHMRNVIWFLLAVTLVAGVSFIDDIHSLPDSVRLMAQFIAMGMMFYQLDILHWNMWWIILLALIICVGASNIINFMDGINGMTGTYAMASLLPLLLLNRQLHFINESLILTVILADVVFCFFNLRPKGKAKCFAGDTGSMGMAYILLFLLGCLIMTTKDVTYLVFLLVYGVDGVLTICHRIMLHENLGKAHRKHAYQLMANELKIGHVKVALFYATLQFLISIGFIYLCPNTLIAHWCYLVVALIVLSVAYIIFMRKYYHLHVEYLESLKKQH